MLVDNSNEKWAFLFVFKPKPALSCEIDFAKFVCAVADSGMCMTQPCSLLCAIPVRQVLCSIFFRRCSDYITKCFLYDLLGTDNLRTPGCGGGRRAVEITPLLIDGERERETYIHLRLFFQFCCDIKVVDTNLQPRGQPAQSPWRR